MKKFLRNGLMLAAAGTLLFTACDPEDETPVESAPEVSLSVETEQDVYLPGDVINLVVDFTADAPVVGGTINVETSANTFSLDVIDGISGDNVIDLNAFGVAGESEGSFNINGLVLPEQAAGMTLNFSVDLEDEDGRVGEGTLDIDIEQASLVNFSAILLAAPLDDETSETFFSTNTGETYSMGQINGSTQPLSANIDFGYFYGTGEAQTGATLASPENYPFDYGQSAWSVRNNTLIRATTVTSSQFNEANLSFINEAFENGTPGSTDGRITNLAEGDVLAFETDASKETGAKRGLLLVEAIVGTDGENDRIEFSIVMEE